MSDFDALTRILAARHSCRAFRPDQVDRAEIEKILTAAQRVPTWCNSQPWQVVVTSGDETDRLRDALTAEAASAPQPLTCPSPRAIAMRGKSGGAPAAGSFTTRSASRKATAPPLPAR